jgi:hypothetical protein
MLAEPDGNDVGRNGPPGRSARRRTDVKVGIPREVKA